MKKLFLTICLFSLASINIFGQDDSRKPTAEEEREAKEVASIFYNRLQETQDIEPLIKEFFIKDFPKRLTFCWTRNNCSGNSRDFWEYENNDDLIKEGVTEKDSLQLYDFIINNFYLSFRPIFYLKDIYPKNKGDSWQSSKNPMRRELDILLKDNPELVKYSFFTEPDEFDGNGDFKTLSEFRQSINDTRKYLSALKQVEAKIRADFQKRNPYVNINLSPKDFEVNVEENYKPFFNYPIGTRILQVWELDVNIPFVMDLIKEDGKLKIVAIYPPMD